MNDHRHDNGNDGRNGNGHAPVAPLPQVCRMLRTKTSYGVGERGAEWKRGESTTAVYWCLATMEAFGADDGYCHPHACTRGRACYEPCPEDEG